MGAQLESEFIQPQFGRCPRVVALVIVDEQLERLTLLVQRLASHVQFGGKSGIAIRNLQYLCIEYPLRVGAYGEHPTMIAVE